MNTFVTVNHSERGANRRADLIGRTAIYRGPDGDVRAGVVDFEGNRPIIRFPVGGRWAYLGERIELGDDE